MPTHDIIDHPDDLSAADRARVNLLRLLSEGIEK